jgi:hypothetical protein
MKMAKWRPVSIIAMVVLLAVGVMVTQAGAVVCDLTPPITEGLACTPSGTTITYSGSGDVTVTFIDSAADFDSWIILYDAVPAAGPVATQLLSAVKTDLLSNREAIGTFVNFDPSLLGFGAGDELIFALAVDTDPNGTGDRDFDASDVEDLWFMGAAGRNSDNHIHADVQSGGPSLAIVGFEDIVGGGDLDHNDHIFSFFPVTIVPNPAALVLVGVGLIGFALADRKRRR